jgi:hypothetical protein
LNPAERRWPLMREVVANWPVGSSAEVDRIVGAWSVTLHDDPVQVCRITNYHGWPWC